MQKRGAVETKQGAKTRVTPEGPAAKNLEIQAQLKKPVKKARTRGACQAPKRKAAKSVAKVTATGGVRHPRIKRVLDDITSLTLDREGTKEAQIRRPNKVSISLNPTCVKEYFVNFTKQKTTCTRYKAACKVKRGDLSRKESELGEITRRLIVRKRDLLPPKALLAVLLLKIEREECDEVTKERRRVCKTQNPTARETVKHEQDGTLAGEPAHEKVVSTKGETLDREGRMNSRHELAAHSTEGEEQPKRHLQNQKNCLEPKKLPKRWRRYKSLKGPSSEPSGKHQFNLSRFKIVLFRKKRAYYESSPCKRKQINWEPVQMCMCRY